MKKLLMTVALGASVSLVSACGGEAETEPAAEDTAVVETTVADTATDWPAGTRIVEENGVTYRVDPAGTRVAIEDGSWRIVTEDEVRYRVDPQGTRVRIDDEGLDLEGVASGPDIPGVDVDVGTNTKGNLDVDVSTDGTDASNDRPNDR